jgi:ABC-2 type transport system permease protein
MSDTTTSPNKLTPRRIRGVNRVGLWTMVYKEIGRFLSVYTQTITAPVITALLFFTIFALAFGGIAREMGDVPFLAFIAPGLVMMTMAQNAFANTSSSVVIAKVQGNIVDVLMPPLSPAELFLGYIAGGVARGLIVGAVGLFVISFFAPIGLYNPLAALGFAILGTMMLSAMGLAAGIWSEKFDHIAAVTNFAVTPLTFLSGTFYSLDRLPPFWQDVAHFNPFFYMIDGFRGGFVAQTDANIWIGFLFLAGMNTILMVLCLWMLRTGYKIKS